MYQIKTSILCITFILQIRWRAKMNIEHFLKVSTYGEE